MNLQSVSKAVAGAIVASLVAVLARRGLVIDGNVSDALAIVIAAVIGFLGVYIAPKNKEV